MGKCPYCGKKINWLAVYHEARESMTLDKNSKPTYKQESDSDDYRWECPECLIEVTDDEKEAIKILNASYNQ